MSAGKKRLVLLSPAHPLRGGIAASSERLARELQNAGHEVEILSFRYQYPDFLFPGKTQYTQDPPPTDLRIESRLRSLDPLNWWGVGRALGRRRPDFLIVRYWLPFLSPCLGSVVRLAKRNRHTRALTIADNVVPHEKRPGDALLTRYFLGAMDGGIAMSRAVEKDLLHFAPGLPVRYVPHPIYDNYGEQVERAEALRHLNLDPDYSYLLFFGFIRRYKGLDLLLRALKEPPLQGRRLRLLVAGEFYDDPQPYHDLIRGLGLTGQVILHREYIPTEEVRYYFGAADLVVQPYRSATQSGITQLAFHFEKPMVVTRVGGLPEIVREGRSGYTAEVEPASIAAAIARFFDREDREALLEGVRQEKQRFSWAHMVAALEDLFGEIERT
ncbi:MAG: glycosyltransferase [Bacteroidetes bacterium]|nr:MAG: glycosyltransferase [Bacteroidota bacterium]